MIAVDLPRQVTLRDAIGDRGGDRFPRAPLHKRDAIRAAEQIGQRGELAPPHPCEDRPDKLPRARALDGPSGGIPARQAGCGEALLDRRNDGRVGNGDGDLVGRPGAGQAADPVDDGDGLAVTVVDDRDPIEGKGKRTILPRGRDEAPEVVEARLGLGPDVGGKRDQGVDPAADTGQQSPLEGIDIDRGEEHDPPAEGDFAPLHGDAPGGLPIPESKGVDLGKIDRLEPGQCLPAGVITEAWQGLVGRPGKIGKRQPIGGQFPMHRDHHPRRVEAPRREGGVGGGGRGIGPIPWIRIALR